MNEPQLGELLDEERFDLPFCRRVLEVAGDVVGELCDVGPKLYHCCLSSA